MDNIHADHTGADSYTVYDDGADNASTGNTVDTGGTDSKPPDSPSFGVIFLLDRYNQGGRSSLSSSQMRKILLFILPSSSSSFSITTIGEGGSSLFPPSSNGGGILLLLDPSLSSSSIIATIKRKNPLCLVLCLKKKA